MDWRMRNDAVYQIVGPSGCGKSMFVTQLLKNSQKYFQNRIGTVYSLMGADEGEVGETQTQLKSLKNVKILKGFQKGWMEQAKRYDAYVIDDLFSEANREKDFNNLFTKVARHRGVTVFFITQNIFYQGGAHRTRNLNVHYLTLFKNPRDSTAISAIAKQAYPKNSSFLVDAYKDAVGNKPHGYLFMDFTQACPDEIRVRTDITDSNITVYKQS